MDDVEASVTTATCIVVLCADCREKVWDQAEGIIHWNTLADAVKSLDDWDWTDPDRPVCPHCRLVRACANGHSWGPWRDCRCGGQIPDHASGCRRFRCCDREIAGHRCDAMQDGDRKAAADA